MWPLGHAAVGYLCYALSTRWRFDDSPAGLPAVALLVGTQFPDLVDKPLAWYLGVLPTGRTLAHSLLFLVPVCALAYGLARHVDRPELGVAFGIGALAHALVDALPALWGGSAGFLLWPVVPVDPYEEGAPSILDLLMSSLSDPYFITEFVLAAVALVLWRRHGYPGLDLLTPDR